MSYGTVVSDAIVTLREWLQSSNPRPGDRVPSERQLMAQLGLTHNAVNRAMTRLISDGLVRREGYKLYYGGEKSAEATRLACDLVVARRSLFIRGYRKVAKSLGIDLRMHYYESVGESVEHLRRLDTRGTECVLFDPPHTLSAATWASSMRRLLAHDIPAVSIGQHADGLFCVLGDQARAVRQVFSHLRDMGHHEMALFSVPPRASSSIEILDAWRSLPWGKAGRASAKRLAYYEDAREDVQILAQRLAGEWKDVTALVVHSVYDPIVPHLLEELGEHKKAVPGDLSIISLGDLPHLTTCVPAVGAAAFDFPLMHETAFRFVQRLAREKQRTGLLPAPACLGVYPVLTARESVRSMHAGSLRTGGEGATDGEEPAESRQDLRAMLRRPYPFIMTAAPDRFAPLDLAPFVNRSLNYRKGWFGDLPLAHFEPGRHRIHGVPFEVIGGAGRADNGVIIFRSRTNERGNSKELPARVRIPINAKIAAVYILHGCGYTRFLSPFASYEFHSSSKKIGEVPLVALGRPPYGWSSAQFEKDARKANIQDWWGDFPHVDFPGTRQAPIVPPDDEAKVSRYAYLYTLEWRNPEPGRTITHMEIKVDPEQSTTLGVIAVTLLKK